MLGAVGDPVRSVERSPGMARKTVEVETTGQAYLELLRERGVEYFFANAGTDFAPLIDAFARFAEQGKQTPKPITVPHENAAVAMAHGYYMVTGKPQMVMVHVNVGTGNAINGIINAARDNVPILFTAGRTPLTEAGLPGALLSISTGRKNRLIRRACCASMSNGLRAAQPRSWKRWLTGPWKSP